MEGPTLHLTFVTSGKLIHDNEVYDYSHSFVCACVHLGDEVTFVPYSVVRHASLPCSLVSVLLLLGTGPHVFLPIPVDWSRYLFHTFGVIRREASEEEMSSSFLSQPRRP
jgi:hypothetical protein